MIDLIKLLLVRVYRFSLTTTVLLMLLQLSETTIAGITDPIKLFPEQDTVEALVRQWAPLVWLAPNEKFMPGDVTEFLHHVHAEKAKPHPHREPYAVYDDEDGDQRYYYETTNELNAILAQSEQHPWRHRHQRMYKDNYLFNYIIDLPIGEHSSNWHLVTNDDVDDLLSDPTSFIYGQSPNAGNVPIYAMVSMCNSTITNPNSDDKTLSISRGHTVTLECPIDASSCGNLHSLKWFKGNERVAVVSGDGTLAHVEGPYSGRITIDHNPAGPFTKLYIKSVQAHDEEIYTCSITYLDPSEACTSSSPYEIKLNVLVIPSTMQMLDENGQTLRNGTTVGPLSEGQRFVSYCEARSGRPKPNVAWYLNGKRLTAETTLTSDGPDANGLFTESAKLAIVLTRKALAATFECRIETEALDFVSRHLLNMDLQVRPKKVEVNGGRQHTVQGNKVALLCKVLGARPPANVTWYNNTNILRTDPTRYEHLTITEETKEEADQTFTTISRLSFIASRFENGANFRCDADNIVMQNEFEKPLHNSLLLQVMYPPVVNVMPDNYVVKEGGEINMECRYDSNPSSLKKVTWKKDGEVVMINRNRMEGGNIDSIGLKIQKVMRTDLGNYTCELQNDYGIGISENAIALDVYYPPEVELLMEPNSYVVESDGVNVTLMCRVISGNPLQLTHVKWLLDGNILKELPECTGNGDDALCGVDPDILLLENVGRHFLGNYSSRGQNAAGEGYPSVDKELIVFYEPGPATLLHYPLVASKKKTITLFCSVEDGGYPNATQYVWLRDGNPLPYDTALITFENIGLDSRANFSCYAQNKGGKGQMAHVELDVLAPPSFIQNLQPRTAALFSAQNISLSCRVECVPLCMITWYKDGIGIERTDDRYIVSESFLSTDKAIGDFESVLSTLYFNMSAWPKQQLDIHLDNANYSCVSSANSEGPGVRSSTDLHVEYPPENTTVSNVTIDVEEGMSPPRISCAGNAYPPLQYTWLRNGDVKSEGPILHIYEAMTRADNGTYECISRNKHGNQSVSMTINILYKPDCTITRRELNGDDTLVCTADGNPGKMSFEWSRKTENETEAEILSTDSDSDTDTVSFIVINDDQARTYRCVANNSVGIGTTCSIEITGQYHWWNNVNPLIIIMASVAVLLFAVIVICCIIICICRKRRQQDKYHTDVSISATHSVLSAQTANESAISRPPTTDIPKSPPKWPLRPGVLVHVKCDTKQTLCANRAQSPFNASHNTSSLHNVSYASPLLNATSRNSSACETSGVGQTRINIGPDLPARNTKPLLLGTGTNNAALLSMKRSTGKSVARALLVDEESAANVSEMEKGDGETTEASTTANINDNNNNNSNGNTSNNNRNNDANEELFRFSTSNVIERIMRRLRWRREQNESNGISSNAANNGTANGIDTNATDGGNSGGGGGGGGILSRSNRRAISLLRATGWFGSGKSTTSTTGLMNDKKKSKMGETTGIDSVASFKRTSSSFRRIRLSDSLTLSFESKEIDETVSPQGKSSLAADLLSDPGEYENLPFHGLQTAPNKFGSYTNTAHGNVVRVAPRQKSNTSATTSPTTITTTPTTQPSSNHSPSIVAAAAAPTYCYNLAHSFPASNSSHNNSNSNNSNNNNNNTSNTNSLHSTYPQFVHLARSNGTSAHNTSNPYQVSGAGGASILDHSNDSLTSTTSAMMSNPFLAKRPKSLNHCRRDRPLTVRPAPSSPPPPPPATLSASAPHPYNTLTMPYARSMALHCTANDKKFNSLKTSAARKKPEFYSLRVSKCRRHQSLENPTYDMQQKLLVINTTLMPFAKRFNQATVGANHSDSEHEQSGRLQSPAVRHSRFNRQPLYENLVNATAMNSSAGHNGDANALASAFDEYYCDANDANSIYRSDSGISNSSFELTPIPAPRNNPRNCQSAPVYVNLPKYVASKKHGAVTTAFNYERFLPTNPFTSSSRRKQILIPKELFPLTRANANADKFALSTSSSSTSSSFRRPVKLPLRKHHSFHFSTAQTVSGALKHEQFQQKHGKATATNRQNAAHDRYKAHGPLIFKPFSEKSAFKPIVPSPQPSNCEHMAGNDGDRNESTVPRICGTSLKRHLSNVETFTTDQWQNATDADNIQPAMVGNNMRRKIHYADLAPLPTSTPTLAALKNDRNANGFNGDDGTNEQINRQRVNASKAHEKADMDIKAPTQYATLRFDEVNIDI